MKYETQVALARRFLHHIEHKTTDMLPRVSYNTRTAYTCTNHFDQEKALLFRKYPLLSGLSCQIPSPGDFITEEYAGMPILLTRGNDGQVRAFMNVCRHRGAQVEMAESGCGRQRFTCPYHAWSYNLDGKLVGLPDAATFGEIDRGAFNLVPVPVQERHGMIFVLHDTRGAPFDVDALLGSELSAELATYQLKNWHHYETRRLEYTMNWKGVIDTFLEIYHVGKLHRTTIAPIFFDNLMAFDPFGQHLRMSIARRSLETVRGRETETPDLLAHMAHVYILFPNGVLVRQGEQVETWRVYPGPTPDTSRMVISMFIPKPAETDSAKRHWGKNMDLLLQTVLKEDFPVGTTIQSNFHTDAQAHVVYGRNEPAIAYFHQMLREAMGVPEPMPEAMRSPQVAAA